MLTSLKFVQGAVAKKDFVPALTHFKIEDCRVQGFNGTLALSSPIPFDIACKPKALPLVKAIANCEETVSLSLTPAGRLAIRSGKFRSMIDCVEGETPHVDPEGEYVEMNGEIILSAFKAVAPFVGDDASRIWTNGVLFKGQSAFATNNVMLVEYWTGAEFPTVVNIPRAAVKEILRINEPPTALQVSENSVTFHFEGERWLRTQLFPTEWPDLSRILDKESNPFPLHESLPVALEMVKPFTDDLRRILFRPGKIKTHEDEMEGASYDFEGVDWQGTYQIEMLELLCGAAKSIDWTLYPSPCLFFGDRLRGAIIGMRQ